VGGAADLHRRAAAIGIDPVGQGRAAAQGQVMGDGRGAQLRAGLQRAVDQQVADTATPGVNATFVHGEGTTDGTLIDQAGAAENLAPVTEIVLAGECPAAGFDVQPFEVPAVAQAATGRVIQRHPVVTAAAVHQAVEAAGTAQREAVIATAKVQRLAIAATDQAIVEDHVLELAHELHAKTVLALDRAVVDQRGGGQS